MDNYFWLLITSIILFASSGLACVFFFHSLTSYLEIKYPDEFQKIAGNNQKLIMWTPIKYWRLWRFVRENISCSDPKLAYYVKGYKISTYCGYFIGFCFMFLMYYSSKHR